MSEKPVVLQGIDEPIASGYRYYLGEKPPLFAEPSERMVAELLERFQIPWQYEPTTFALSRNEDGTLAEGFRPDFYLPEKGIYIECTVQKQSLVTRKNRKVRMVQQLYGIKVKRCYRRQMEWLAARYGYSPEQLVSPQLERHAAQSLTV